MTYGGSAPIPAPAYGQSPYADGPQWTQTLPVPGQPSAPAPKQSGGIAKAAIAGVAAVAIALAAGGVGGFVGYALHGGNDSPLQTTSTSGNNGGAAAPIIDRSSLASIAASVQPTVVDIRTQQGEGSGVVISADGYIVTNNHVVAGANGSSVRVSSRRRSSVPIRRPTSPSSRPTRRA
jgi:putative serine protease PepD